MQELTALALALIADALQHDALHGKPVLGGIAAGGKRAVAQAEKALLGKAPYRFGENAGVLKGTIQTMGMRLELVRPQVWQKAFSLGTASACASKTIWKNKLKAEAQRRFPHLEVTLKTADALLILEYALMKGLNH